MNSFPDWLVSDFQQLAGQYRQQRLPHGLLVVSQAGDGSELLLKELIALILCAQPGDSACGNCKNCQLLATTHHPDYLKIEPEGKSQTIKVEAIRGVVGKVSETAQQGGSKIIHIAGAETMNVNAANALLKVLEEPTDNTFIFLETTALSRLLPTIRSRCRIQTLSRPSEDEALAYLESSGFNGDRNIALTIAGGGPILASSLSESEIDLWQEREKAFSSLNDFVSLSQFVNGQDLKATFSQVLHWIDLGIRLQAQEGSVNHTVSESFTLQLQGLDTVTLFNFRDYILGKLSAINRQANLNAQLMGEELAANWLALRGNQ